MLALLTTVSGAVNDRCPGKNQLKQLRAPTREPVVVDGVISTGVRRLRQRLRMGLRGRSLAHFWTSRRTLHRRAASLRLVSGVRGDCMHSPCMGPSRPHPPLWRGC
jgi:hypothetical protein